MNQHVISVSAGDVGSAFLQPYECECCPAIPRRIFDVFVARKGQEGATERCFLCLDCMVKYLVAFASDDADDTPEIVTDGN